MLSTFAISAMDHQKQHCFQRHSLLEDLFKLSITHSLKCNFPGQYFIRYYCQIDNSRLLAQRIAQSFGSSLSSNDFQFIKWSEDTKDSKLEGIYSTRCKRASPCSRRLLGFINSTLPSPVMLNRDGMLQYGNISELLTKFVRNAL